jgi:hypothetical protein
MFNNSNITNINNDSLKLIINFQDLSLNIFNEFINIHDHYKKINIFGAYKINIDIIKNNYELYLFLVECIKKSYIYILKSNLYNKLFENINIWNICIVQNIMFNFPFTLQNFIYIPLNYIEKNYKNMNSIDLIKTLIHEKIHIGQRYKEKIWEEYIKKTNKNWIKIYKNNKINNILDYNIKNNKISLIDTNEEFINNPDTFYNNFKYIYHIDNNFYYGNYVYNSHNKNAYIKYFEIDILNNRLKKTNIRLEHEHPYEIYAYIISQKIIDTSFKISKDF